MSKTERELQAKVKWLENRYSQMVKVMADACAETLPLELQQKFFLNVTKKLDKIRQDDFTQIQRKKQ